MNKLVTTATGGFPVVLDDFRWMDEAYRNGFYGLLTALGVADNESFVLSGCVRSVSVGTVTVTEGYVVINGEVFYMPEQTYAEPTTETEYFDIAITYDAAGFKTFQDASTNDTYQIRRAKITVSDTPPAEFTDLLNVQTLPQRLHDLLVNKANIFTASYPPPPFDILFNSGDIVISGSNTYIVTDSGYVLIA